MRIRKSMSNTVFAILVACIAAVVAAAQQPSQVPGKTNLHAWIDEAPGLPKNLEEASARKNGNYANGGSFYQSFYDKVEAFKKTYKEAVAGQAKPNENALRNTAQTQLNGNLARVNSLPIIAQMGGLEKLAQMTPEQRAQLAQQMMQSMQQNPADATARSAAGTQRLQPNNDAATTIAIRKDLELMIQQRGALDTAFRNNDSEITNSKGNHREINQDAAENLAKIPMVNDSVMGRVHDLAQEAALNKDTAARHRERAKWELQQRTVLFTDQKLKLNDLANSYQNWLKNNQDKINASTAPGDLLRGTNTEVAVAEYEVSFIDAAYDLAKYSEAATKDAASYEELYLQGSGAIRRRK
jgi:hypothetical protein